MGKSLRKILATVLTICMVATMLAVPMTVNAEAPQDETYEAYDVINYLDLKDENGNYLASTGTALSGGRTLKYDRTSSTGSAILKYRWTIGKHTVDNVTDASLNVSFESINSAPGYMFGALFTDTAVNYRPYNGFPVNLNETLKTGTMHDIEFARLKVATGENAGKYYVYLKVDGEKIAENYTAVDTVGVDGTYRDPLGVDLSVLSGEICFACHGVSGTKISQIPDYTYEDYDTITYWDLKDAAGNPLAESGTNLAGSTVLKYTPNSPTGSAMLKYRLTAGDAGIYAPFNISFEKYGDNAINYLFGGFCEAPSDDYPNGDMWLIGGDKYALPFALQAGQTYDIEFARLKIKSGRNAGCYHVYLKINNVMVAEKYVAAGVVASNGDYTSTNDSLVTANVLSGDIVYTCHGVSGTKITATPEDETYEDYDEITYFDLKNSNGNYISDYGSEFAMTEGANVFSYNRTSNTGSAIFKYRWTAGATPGFQLSFEKKANNSIEYKFGALLNEPDTTYTNGSLNFRPYYGYATGLPVAVATGSSYDIEFARLMVKTGRNKGKYYVYFKINGVTVAENYTNLGDVDASGNYAPDPNDANMLSVLSAQINIGLWGKGAGHKISASTFEEEYEPYDEVYYSNLKYGGQPVGAETNLRSGSNVFTYDRTSPTGSAIFKARWTVGDSPSFQLSFEKDASNGVLYKFGALLNAPDTTYTNGSLNFRPYYGYSAALPAALTTGSSHDIEFARLKVKNGPNAGKYKVYFKIDGVTVAENYTHLGDVDENGNYTVKPDDDVTYSVLSGEINMAFWGNANNKLSEIPYTQEYETYDEVDYEDLSLNGEPVSANGTEMTGGTKTLTYVPESPTGSAILKYRWTVGAAPAFQLSFGNVNNEVAYSFCAWMDQTQGFQNGRIWMCPGNSLGAPEANCAFAIAPNSSHNVEFARLKVKNGPKKGQYYVYLKIDDVLFNETYVAANVVDANGNYHDYRNVDNNVLSGEFLFNFSGSNGSIISAYKEALNGEHLGVRGDFDESGIFNAADLAGLVNLIIGATDASTLPTGIGDFNNDKSTDILDLIAMKRYLAPINSITRSGNLALGTQEHLYEDETKTPQYIADASKALGASYYRLGLSIATLFWHKNTVNEVVVNEENMAKFKAQIKALKDNGITNILFVTDSFMLPYEYASSQNIIQNSHNLTVPNPKTEKEAYENWLKINANAFKKLAEECPEIRFFEPGNELNLAAAKLEKYGISWESTADRTQYKYTVKEKAGILADLCWNVSNAVKSVNPANQVTTPSISVQDTDAVQSNFADELYKAIESGAYPSNQTLGDKRIDNYFSILNIHIYPHYNTTTAKINSDMASYVNQVNSFYNVAKAHNDGGSRVWITETGLSTSGTRTDDRDKDIVASILTATLNNINNNLTFVDTVFIYKLADVSTEKGMSDQETDYGLFFSGEDIDCAHYGVKPSANAVAAFFRGAEGADWLNWLIGVYHE